MENTKKGDVMHLDDGETIWLERQLVQVKTKSYNVKYSALRAAMLIPVSTEIPSGSKFIDWVQYSRLGEAKIIASYSKDFPRTDLMVEEKRSNVKGVGDSFGYNIPEIRRSASANPPIALNQQRANNAMEIVDRKIDAIAWNGDTTYGLQGFIDYPGIQEYTLIADGVAGSKTWASKTPDQIIRDINGLLETVTTSTNRVENPDTVIMPSASHKLISTRRMTETGTTTVLEFLLKTNEDLNLVTWVVELAGAGAGATERIMAYVRDDGHLTLEIPQVTEQIQADKKGMEYVVPVHGETGGVIVYYPLSVVFADGV